jgi:hypothetical protein
MGDLELTGALLLRDNEIEEVPEGFTSIKAAGIDLSQNQLRTLPESFVDIQVPPARANATALVNLMGWGQVSRDVNLAHQNSRFVFSREDWDEKNRNRNLRGLGPS